MTHRPLIEKERQILEGHNCTSENWDLITVSENFNPDRIRNTRFAGAVQIGRLDGELEIEPGYQRPAGISDAFIKDCIIGDNVIISRSGTIIGYVIEENCVLENVGFLTVLGKSSFGNGVEIEVLNEGGGRELPLFDRLSAQIAYILVNYRHDPELISALRGMIENYAESKKSDRGIIGRGTRIRNTNRICDVIFGENCTVNGAQLLENGSINSTSDDPVYITDGVIAKDFIVMSGARIDGAAMISKCFVGQAVKMGRQFSGENSVFFANSEAFHSEACSIFAGPYTVTHHKSTLLIAGLFSFYNAGSGTNQSNHMYKLGPLHQGVLERGAKTGSFSYMLWPSRVGAFSAVIGKHYSNFDTSLFPFSYIDEQDGKSVLTPAMNLFTVGTRRDSAKWPQRDKRKGADKLDLLHFEVFSPYTIGKIVQAIEILQKLSDETPVNKEMVQINGVYIKRLLLKRCRKYYEMAVKIYIGNEILNQLKANDKIKSFSELKQVLLQPSASGIGHWVDASGMLTSAEMLQAVLNEVREGRISGIGDLEESLRGLHSRYEEANWSWCKSLLANHLQHPVNELSIEELMTIISDWQDSMLKLDNMILSDSQKEFDVISRIGFGIDGDNSTRDRDFEAVRGTHETNKFVKEIKSEMDSVTRSAETWINHLKNLET